MSRSFRNRDATLRVKFHLEACASPSRLRFGAAAAALAGVLIGAERIAAMPNTGAAALPLPKGDALPPLLRAGAVGAVPPLLAAAVPFGCKLLLPFGPVTCVIAAALPASRLVGASVAVVLSWAVAAGVASDDPPAIVVSTGRGEKGLALL